MPLPKNLMSSHRLSTAPWISVGFAVTVMVGFVGTRSKLTHGWQSKDPQPAKESRKQYDESTD